MDIRSEQVVDLSRQGVYKRLAQQQAQKFLNVGYGEGGASRVKRSMKGWTTTSASPREDIDLNLNPLRMRSRDLAQHPTQHRRPQSTRGHPA